MHLIAPDIGILGTVPIVSATISLAVGSGMASKLRQDDLVSVSFFGDGAVEEGQFHESLNLAAHYKLPVIFVCENNLYSSHMHLLERRVKDNIFMSGAVHGVPAEQVDGNDVIAVYSTASAAIQHARSGQGPTLLEYRTFRWRGHVGSASDMDVGLKRKDELKAWLKKDPISFAKNRLLEKGIAQKVIQQIDHAADEEVEQAVLFARVSPFPGADTLKDHLFHVEGRMV